MRKAISGKTHGTPFLISARNRKDSEGIQQGGSKEAVLSKSGNGFKGQEKGRSGTGRP
jgi:hypothetical protein